MFKERAQVYSDVLADESFSLGVEGTENSWLSDSSYYVSAKLRNHIDASDELNPAVQTKSNAKYSAEDIKAMKQYSRERLETEDYHTYNEEHLGFMMGFNRALADSIGDNIAVSDNGRALLAKALQQQSQINAQ